MPSFYEQIAWNKRKTYAIVFLFFIIVLLAGWAFGELMGFGSLGLVFALIVSLPMTFGSYYFSDSIVLKISQAKPLERKQNKYLYDIVDALAIGSGIPKPHAYIIDDSAPNAFATGRDPEHAVVCVTTGLLDKLKRQELEGGIAHELSHIKNYDTLLMTIAAVMVGMTALMSDIIIRGFMHRGNSNDRGGGKAGMVLLVVALVLIIITPIIAQLMKFALSRQREFLADASAAKLTRYPPALASALEKISKDKEPLEAANKATAGLYIINPLKEHSSFLNNMFATHPPIEERIKRLRAM